MENMDYPLHSKWFNMRSIGYLNGKIIKLQRLVSTCFDNQDHFLTFADHANFLTFTH